METANRQNRPVPGLAGAIVGEEGYLHRGMTYRQLRVESPVADLYLVDAGLPLGVSCNERRGVGCLHYTPR